MAQEATFTIGEPGCRVVNPNPRRHERIEWSGGCRNGYADGAGVLLWYRDEALVQRYEGPLVAGQPEGRGAMSYSGGAARYEGGFHNGKRHGAGVLTYPNGARLGATFDNGEPVGPVHVSAQTYEYDGGWLDGKPHGSGRIVYADGTRYEGGWRAGRFHGAGVLTSAGGERSEALWENGALLRPLPASSASP